MAGQVTSSFLPSASRVQTELWSQVVILINTMLANSSKTYLANHEVRTVHLHKKTGFEPQLEERTDPLSRRRKL